MAGQLQLDNYNKQHLLEKYTKILTNQVNLQYIKDKFGIKTDFDKDTAKHAFLVKELFEEEVCETIEYFNINNELR